MSLIVQKFGGSSVADTEKIRAAARKAVRGQQGGNQVVMVVSAMGKNTDQLERLAREINEHPPARELDMLLSTGEQVSVALMAMAIDALGHRAVSLTGGQIGIRTDSSHTKARIRSISTDRVRRLLDAGNIVIAAGFQGIDDDWNITTLGRGGSDTTAVALAAVLGAELCEIYTDVDGVYTTDPRILPEARRVARISYDEMLELASLGAGVMHNRSIEFAKKFGVPIHVRNSMSDAEGTLICSDPESLEAPVCGAAVTSDEARITILGVPDVPGTSHDIFSRLAAERITVDMIVQNVGRSGKADVSFTVPTKELAAALDAVQAACTAIGADDVLCDERVAKVSVVGAGMARQIGVADRMFQALADAGVNIQMITTSEIKISVLVQQDEARVALRAVHDAFGLSQVPRDEARRDVLTVERASEGNGRPDAADIVTRLRETDMEQLVIDDVSLDQSQSLVTLHGVPDRPGVAARVFREIAQAGVFVDMIVQSHHGDRQRTGLSFTIPQADLQRALETVSRLATQLGFDSVSHVARVAKLSVSGIGLRSHTSAGTRMFGGLAAAGINVKMINTSEVRVNMVVDGADGPEALSRLEAAFADVRG